MGPIQAPGLGGQFNGNHDFMLSNSGVGKRLLSVEEAAGYLGLQVDTVYKKARLRELPSVKVGRERCGSTLRALERFVEQHTIETIE